MPVEGQGDMDLGVWPPSLGLDGLGAAAALAAGLASSAHCALMCGPLACAATAPAEGDAGDAGERLIPLRRRRRKWAEPFAYHVGRLGAYAAVGAGLGLAGEGARRALAGVTPALPWVMAGALAATAFGVGKRLPLPAALKRLARPVVRKAAKLSPLARSAAIGASTPLLPCASLYGLLLAAVATASALGGAGLMAAFAIGATPALAFVQAHAPLLDRFPRAAGWLRRAVPLLAAAALVWRAVHAGSDTAPPACH
jgi:uncharacterized protein